MNNYFDKIYCISAPDNTDRWDNVKKEFGKINLSLDNVKLISEQFTENNCKYQSHNDLWIKIIEDAKSNNYEKILIFEDDFKFIDYKIFDKFITDLENYDKSWDLFHLGGLYKKNVKDLINNRPLMMRVNDYFKKYPKHFQRITNNLLCVNGGSLQTTHSVAIRNTLFDKIIDFDKLDNRLQPDDHEIFIKNNTGNKFYKGIISMDILIFKEFQDNDNYKTYAAYPSITESSPNISTLSPYNKIQDLQETKNPIYRVLSKIKPLINK